MTTALYRRYRPDTFADVIGQEHVTDPLRAALRADRATHAYLFSGPRGCGKTTSARILARCLNCAQGPTDSPCGVCESCVELARGGPGSLDVVEIDAASHGGVDDARDLRERAVFAPARDRYKVFIIDEAHMVTPQGFNALLKLVEEPPAHVKFVFATTEPDKVIGTIRSRTHHYPFRLVPPAVLQTYLASLCEAEHIEAESGVLPLVVRAGGGSVRDSLSVLDQLMAGAQEDAVSYHLAAALLGFTPATLLDDAVGALAAGDGAAVFRVVDHVVESGRDPRRFVEDLLDRLRDLIVIAASGEEAADAVLRALPADELDRMRPQARALGPHRLSVIADIVNTGLTEMAGATSPRLQLELVLTRALLAVGAFGAAPAVTHAPAVEDRPAGAGTASGMPDGAASPPRPGRPGPGTGEQAPSAPRADEPQTTVAPTVRDASASSESGGRSETPGRSESVGRSETAHRDEVVHRDETSERTSAEAGRAGAVDSTEVRRRWPEVLETLKGLSRATWTLVESSGQPGALADGALTVRLATAGLAQALTRRDGALVLKQALYETLGVEARIVIEVGGPDDDGGPGGPGGSGGPAGPGGSSGPGGPDGPGGPGAGRGSGGPGAGRGSGDRESSVRAGVARADTGGADTPASPGLPTGPAPSAAARSEAVARALADWDAPAGSSGSSPASRPVPASAPGPASMVAPAPQQATPSTAPRTRAMDAEGPATRAASAPAGGIAPDAATDATPAPATARPTSATTRPTSTTDRPTSATARPAPAGPPSARVAVEEIPPADEPPAPWEDEPPPPWEDLPPVRGQQGVPPVIDLDSRRRPGPGNAPTDEDTFAAEIAGSVDANEAGGMVGAPLVARMLGGVVIDELVDGSEGRR